MAAMHDPYTHTVVGTMHCNKRYDARTEAAIAGAPILHFANDGGIMKPHRTLVLVKIGTRFRKDDFE
jgi:hypothetical protein